MVFACVSVLNDSTILQHFNICIFENTCRAINAILHSTYSKKKISIWRYEKEKHDKSFYFSALENNLVGMLLYQKEKIVLIVMGDIIHQKTLHPLLCSIFAAPFSSWTYGAYSDIVPALPQEKVS